MQLEQGFEISALHESILILPSVAIGNIPQLSSDLLLHTLGFVKVATLQDGYLYPFVSPVDHAVDSPAPPGVSYGLELYYSVQHHLTLVQQRSPIIPGLIQKHIQEVITPLVKSIDPLHVVLLDLADAGLMEQVLSGEIKIFTNEDLLSQAFQALQIRKNDAEPISESQEVYSTQGKETMKQLDGKHNLIVLETFVYEGDNFYDSRLLAAKLAGILKIDVKEWKAPASWLGVYGDKPVPDAMEDGLFG